MERLTEKVLGFVQLKTCGNDFCKETCVEHDEEKDCNNCPIQKAFEKLAEYEDLEEQGKLLKLPCAVGDTVFCVYMYSGGGRIPDWGEVYQSEFSVGMYENFGKTIFMKEEEADIELRCLEKKAKQEFKNRL